jgi:hypothetical protein
MEATTFRGYGIGAATLHNPDRCNMRTTQVALLAALRRSGAESYEEIMKIRDFEAELDILIERYLETDESEQSKNALVFLLQATCDQIACGEYDRVNSEDAK